MKLIILLLIIFLPLFGAAKEMSTEEKMVALEKLRPKRYPYVPKQGFIPDATVAVQVAEAILKPILKEEINVQLPLKASRANGSYIWKIEGRGGDKCTPQEKNCFKLDQTPIYLEIDGRDGRIIKLYDF